MFTLRTGGRITFSFFLNITNQTWIHKPYIRDNTLPVTRQEELGVNRRYKSRYTEIYMGQLFTRTPTLPSQSWEVERFYFLISFIHKLLSQSHTSVYLALRLGGIAYCDIA